MARTAADTAPYTVRAQGWAGGLNIRDAVNLLQPDEARVMENGILNERGAFDKRLGCLGVGTFGGGADRCISLYEFRRGANAPQFIMHTSGGFLYYTTDPTANPIVWTQIASGLSTTVPLSFETFSSKVYMGNGVDAFASWDGTTYSTYPSAPKGAFTRLWKDTMFISGVPGLPDRIYESAAGDAETWPVASWVDIGKGDGDVATGLGSDGFTLIFFKLKRHFTITDPATLANRVVDFEKGCESHFSIIQFEGYIYFLSRRGICRYLGDAPSEVISYKLDPLFDPAVLNYARMYTAWAFTMDTRLSWALPEIGHDIPTMQVDYYPRLAPTNQFGSRGVGPWAFNRIPGICFTRYRWQGTEMLLCGSNSSNKVFRCYAPVGTDDGAQFTAILETGTYDFGAPTREKYIRDMLLLARGRFLIQIRENYESAILHSEQVDLSSHIDLWNPTTDVWGSGTWGPDSLLKLDRIIPDVYAKAFAFRFADYGETGTGWKPLSIGSLDLNQVVGQWGLYNIIFSGTVLGVRE